MLQATLLLRGARRLQCYRRRAPTSSIRNDPCATRAADREMSHTTSCGAHVQISGRGGATMHIAPVLHDPFTTFPTSTGPKHSKKSAGKTWQRKQGCLQLLDETNPTWSEPAQIGSNQHQPRRNEPDGGQNRLNVGEANMNVAETSPASAGSTPTLAEDGRHLDEPNSWSKPISGGRRQPYVLRNPHMLGRKQP